MLRNSHNPRTHHNNKNINFMYFLHKKVENLTEKLYNIRQDK
ncbi:hypothetical protein COPCOM_00277 [Coprococcus comes ATCC 27758]|uniref:Uncharacterized protein n=1 Tax=Coprococcus comes ATCC 27758 TaxID=470146 RepID=C0B557_9FIRM|nr:hypothetical protein COPCOM_00277 [Coprococcus comes ATCC 27758]